MKKLESLIVIIAVLCSLFSIADKCSYKPPIISTDTVTVETVRDSIIYRDTTIFKTDTLWQTKYKYREAPIEPGEDSTSVYSDLTRLSLGLDLRYTASVTGRLNWIRFEHFDSRPDTFKIVNRTTTITNTIAPSGVYLLGGLRSDQSFNFGAAYLRNRWQYQYALTPGTDRWIHEVKIGYKIF